MTKKISVQDVARYFLYLGNKNSKYITNKKLQKLVYYSQVWFCAIKGKKLFDSDLEAWVHGPVVRSLYFEYKRFGFGPIIKEIGVSSINISAGTKKFLDDIWRIYGSKDPGYLELLTHSEEPWQEAREGLDTSESSSNVISLKTAQKYYSAKLKSIKNA